jgi:antitoxin (DNA-binding transcriptional repressor) of toxin-antitoxin stability system
MAIANESVEVHELTVRFPQLAALLAAGEEVIVTEGRVPKAKLVGCDAFPGGTRTPGLHPGALVPTADFDHPLDDEFWTGQP